MQAPAQEGSPAGMLWGAVERQVGHLASGARWRFTPQGSRCTLSAKRLCCASATGGEPSAAAEQQQLRQQQEPSPARARLLGGARGASGGPQLVVPRAAAVDEVIAREAEEQVKAVVALPNSDEDEELLRLRHSCAHVMAMAVQRLKPSAQVTIGPWIERGFYYDFAVPEDARILEGDLKAIQKEMQKIIKQDLPITREEVSAEEASRRIQAIGEPYKQEILDGIVARTPEAPITIYHIGGEGQGAHWWDLCAGPHVPSTGKINPGAVQLETLAGAYWRGDERREMLQRIYGTAWQTKEQLKAYKQLKEEAARRDHRKLGQELDLFSINESAGPGLVFWHPKGARTRAIIEDFWRATHLRRGYDILYTPHVADVELWKRSGHYQFYAENMFEAMEVEGAHYQLRPMNCPFHIAVYKRGQYSYRDLPLRWAELGTVYRYERSGAMHGLFRVRGFTQDDAHIFCLPGQIAGEIVGVLALVEEVLGAFGFAEFEVELSTRPEKSVGSDAIWATAEAALAEALGAKGWPYREDPGGGAFYGPKIDIKIKDALGRKWQCSTIQLDFNLPERFQMEYKDSDNTMQQPIMIHRALLGSIERFFGIITENYAGAFPLWLAPVQVRLLPITENCMPWANEAAALLRSAGIRVEVSSGERINKLIRLAERAKTGVMGVIGPKEVEGRSLAVRTYGGGEHGSLPLQEVIDRVNAAVEARTQTF